MDNEIVAKIPEYSTARLHVDNTGNVLHNKNEVLDENYSENDENCHAIDASGQIVPSQDTEANICSASNLNKKASDNNGLPTVPQASFEAMEYLDEARHVFKENEMNQESLPIQEGSATGLEHFISPQSTGCESNNHERIKIFLWPPIGFKDQVIEQAAPRKPDTFDQVVSNTSEENDDIEITITKQLTTPTSPSHYVDESEAINSQEENKKLTSILKKDDNQQKKKIQVHFPENIVSVKFYDISDDEDSDTDTVILSDSEDDDYLIRDQEVPFNIYNDYTNNYCLSSSQILNFIPQFSFPPELKIVNYQLYENINDDEEQIMAIMDDDDGHQQPTLPSANDLVTDGSIPEDSVSDCQDEKITSPEMKTLSKNPKKSLQIVELHVPVTKREIEELEDEAKTDKSIGEMMGTGSDSLVVKEDVTSRETIEENIESTVMLINAPTFQSDTKDVIAEENTLQHTLRCENPCINKPTACDNHPNTSNDSSVSLATKQNIELVAESKVEPALNMECNTERNESFDDRMDATPASSNSSTRIFRGNCGSTFMWHGPRTINSMVLDEDFQVSLIPAVDDIYRRSLANVVKEDITFPKVGMVDVGSCELNVLSAVWNERVVTKYGMHEEFKHRRYVIDSLISSPNHLTEFEETMWGSAIETDIKEDIKKLKNDIHSDVSQNDHLKSGNAKSGEQHERDIHEDPGMKPLSETTTFKDENQSVTSDYSKEYGTANCNEKRQEDDGHHLASQIVPDMDVKDRLKTELVEDSARAVPSGVDDIMDATNMSLHLTDYPLQSHKTMEPNMSHDVQQAIFSNNELEKEERKTLSHTSVFKQTSDSPYSQTLYLTKQARLKLRVGLSKSTRVKPLHPYWSKERIK